MITLFKQSRLVLSVIPALAFVVAAESEPLDSSDLSVHWELVSNTYHEEPRAKARFVIENNSALKLTDGNWELFYNQRPVRTPISSVATSPVELVWINGNWWKLSPVPEFELGPGEELTITYEVRGWWIKEESDAPAGLYIVLYDDEGNDEAIIPIDDYSVEPFVRPEQMQRHRTDPLSLPTPENRHKQAERMKVLDEKALHRVIPNPVRLEAHDESAAFNLPLGIVYEEGLENEADYLAAKLGELTARPIVTTPGTEVEANGVLLQTSRLRFDGANEEAYRLNVRSDSTVTITGATEAGVFYGIQTLRHLLPLEVYLGETEQLHLPVMTVEDAPRFGYRGLHIDVARNFQSRETLLKSIDLMAFYKLNVLHFYLTDDEGWRIEIKDLPELTEVGGKRGHPTEGLQLLPPAYGSGPFPYAEGTYGSGYYTREEFVEILRYAKDRHVTVIPSINLPAHARAAIRAMEVRYDRFMEKGDEEAANEFRLIDPDDTSEYVSPQRYTDNVANVARESVYHFFEKVTDELEEMYAEAGAPFDIMHTGGDEVSEGAWAESPMARELLDTLPDIKDPQNLQAYFSRRVFDSLLDRGLEIGGWEEVAQIRDESGAYVPNPEFAGGDVITYIWRNQGRTRDLAYRLANEGYPVVLCHRSNFYFDLAYSNHPRDPGHYSAGFINTRDAWQYAPYDIYKTTLRTRRGHPIDIDEEFAEMERLRPDARANILGVQAHLWTETVFGQDMLEYYLLPRVVGFAESAWAAERPFEVITDREEREDEMQRAWNVFANTLARKQLPRLSVLDGGYNYRIPMPGGVVKNGRLKANIKYPGLEIRYTTNGEEPTLESAKYTGPVEVSGPVKLKAFDRAGRSSETTVLE